ncbi:peroxide stress protein YaaA [Utexia brackfieldae]|uniref:peroxide stress protein YaaA n=1 Tax=Utexia brackfieldae TaxID=3074108 RepID=UPI00370D72D4
MLTVISPAKTLDYESPIKTKQLSQPAMLANSQQLIERARQLTQSDLEKLMKISPALAKLNHERFAQWHQPFTLDNARQAILAFKGDVYEGLNTDDFVEQDFTFAQHHLRILSGLYGLLRPLDLIQPYRLEMGIRLDNSKGKNLYAFWANQLTDNLNQQLAEQDNPALINLASDEYFKVLPQQALKFPVIKPIFMDEKKGEYKIISFYAKKARGLMSRFIIKNRLNTPAALTEFNTEGYQFDKQQSINNTLIFKRTEKAALANKS